jgi:predicted permease
MDLRYALRQLLKSPGFTAVAVITLALGIGANTAIFSFMSSWILKPLPFHDPDRITVVFETNKQTGVELMVTPGDFKDWREHADVFEDAGAIRNFSYNLTGSGEPEKLQGAEVSASFFRVLGTSPVLGRNFTDRDEIKGAEAVAIVSHEFWRDHLSSDRQVLGKAIQLDGSPFKVIGVLSEKFQFIPAGRVVVWTPLSLTPELQASRETRALNVIARLKPGISLNQARAAMTALQASLEKTYPLTNTNRGVSVRTQANEVNMQSGNGATGILYGIVCFILLIACANVANLLLSRATARRKEMAVRLAVGATRWRLIRLLLTETMIVFFTGAIGGILLSQWAVEWLMSIVPVRARGYIPNYGRVEIDAQVLLVTVAITLLTGLIFGLAPALQGTKLDLNTTLKDSGARGTSSLSGSLFRKFLVAGEMALAVVVVVFGALLTNSFIKMMKVDPGFRG